MRARISPAGISDTSEILAYACNRLLGFSILLTMTCMTNKKDWRQTLRAVLPHEWIFNAYLLLTGLRLFVHGGTARSWSFLFFGCSLVSIIIFFWAKQNLTAQRWRVRLLCYPCVMGISFFAMGIAVPLLEKPKVDALLLSWDHALLGETPAVAWEAWLRPWAEDIAMAGYLFFFYYLLWGSGYYYFKNLRVFRTCIVGLLTMYGLAFTGYTFMPAGGPWSWMTFTTSLHGAWLVDRAMGAIDAGSNAVDVFPSVHVAAMLYLLLFDWRYERRRFWLYLTPCIVLWFSTMYLRFHYFVDVLAGAALGLFSFWIAQRYARATQHEPMQTV